MSRGTETWEACAECYTPISPQHLLGSDACPHCGNEPFDETDEEWEQSYAARKHD